MFIQADNMLFYQNPIIASDDWYYREESVYYKCNVKIKLPEYIHHTKHRGIYNKPFPPTWYLTKCRVYDAKIIMPIPVNDILTTQNEIKGDILKLDSTSVIWFVWQGKLGEFMSLYDSWNPTFRKKIRKYMPGSVQDLRKNERKDEPFTLRRI